MAADTDQALYTHVRRDKQALTKGLSAQFSSGVPAVKEEQGAFLQEAGAQR